jgi:hypothetical protein
MFEGNEYFGGQKQCFLLKTLLQCSQHCSHLGNDSPIRIVEGEPDTKYKGRVLGHRLYDYIAQPWATVHRRFVRCAVRCAVHCTYDVHYVAFVQCIIYYVCTMYNIVYR